MIKPLFWMVILAAWSMVATAQTNLVPNGNFEAYTNCPAWWSAIDSCTGWTTWSEATPDYLHPCNDTANGPDVPLNAAGYQYPASGNAYVGIYSHVFSNYKEYITRKITPMQTGVTYEVSLSISLADRFSRGTNDIGVYFFKNGATYNTTDRIVRVTPQVWWTNTVVTDTQNWVRLTQTFTADSAYDNIVIGGFLDSLNATSMNVGQGSSLPYYYIDSVVVTPNDSVYFLLTDTLFCAGDTFTLNYNVPTPSPFSTGNVFSAELSDPTGSFGSGTTVIGSTASNTSGSIHCTIPLTIAAGKKYRVRVLGSNPAYASNISTRDITIGIRPRSLNVAIEGTPLCVGDDIKLDVSSSTPGVGYNWSGPSGFSTISSSITIPNANESHNGHYVVTASVYHCVSTDSIEVIVNQYPEVNINDNSPVCVDSALQLVATADIPGVTYAWTGPGNFSTSNADISIFNSSIFNTGKYHLTASHNGCEVTQSVTVEVIDIDFNLTDDTTLCDGETITLGADVTDGTFLWQDGSTGNAFTVTEGGTYRLEISHPACGIRSDDVDVSYEKCECEPFIPSAFTPNKDGLNDKIGPILYCGNARYVFRIFNRWGETVFASTNPEEKWAGTYNGQEAELGTYYYLLQLTNLLGKKYLFKGDITLLR